MTFSEAWPQERLLETERHLRRVWSGAVPCTYSSLAMLPHYRQMEDETHQHLLAAENILNNAAYPGYNLPRVVVDYGTVSTAAFWGGRIRLPVGGCLSIEPVIFSQEAADAARPGDPASLDCARGAALFGRVCETLGTDAIFCTSFDIQGPLNTAALLWEQADLMMAMVDEPEAVHRFLDRVTDALIAQIRAYMTRVNGRLCGNVWPYIWLPPDIGICITEDYMPLLSPAMYKEFGIPYVERLSREFGGLFIHCCGDYERHLQNLRDAEINLLGLEFHYPYMRLEPLQAVFGGSVVLVPYLGVQEELEFVNKTAYFEHLAAIKRPDTRLWFSLHPEEEDYASQVATVQRICDVPGPDELAR